MEHVARLFGSDAGFRSHIWLEGQRLEAVGFNAGQEYTQVWLSDKIICIAGKIDHFTAANGDTAKLFHRKVNKQGDNPAIRIEGKRVQKLFGEKFLNVRATFVEGRIVIEGNDPVYVQSIPQSVQTEPIAEAA